MTSSQQFIPIEDIKDNLVFLKDGSVTLVINTSAVNFGLLFETEQASIINSFAGLLNSLSFPIQIVILSKRLDVSSYLQTLDQAAKSQKNPLLQAMTLRFREFIQSIIKEKNVLDKQFYICINVSALEMGVFAKTITDKSKKAATILAPRRDHLIKQLAQLGLKARQLDTIELIKLFYSNFNPERNGQIPAQQPRELPAQAIQSKEELQTTVHSLPIPPSDIAPQHQTSSPLQSNPQTSVISNLPFQRQGFVQNPFPSAGAPNQHLPQPTQNRPLTAPFVVEELPDDIQS